MILDVAFKTFKANEILDETRVELFANICVSLPMHICVLWPPLCLSVRCYLNVVCIVQKCVLVCSAAAHETSVFSCPVARVVARPRQQQESRPGSSSSSSGPKAGKQQLEAAAAAEERLQVCTGLHTLEPFKGGAKLQQFVLQSAAGLFEPTGFLKSAVCLSCFSRHPCCPTAPDLSYFLGRFYHLVVTACLFVWLIVFTSSMHCNASSNNGRALSWKCAVDFGNC